MWFPHKFLTIKVDDIHSALTEEEQQLLNDLALKVQEYRTSIGKKINSYIVVNTDEDYAMIVSELIAIGEAEKHRQEGKTRNDKNRT